jgi:hypothetical protein
MPQGSRALLLGFGLPTALAAQARPTPVILGFPSSVQAAGLAGAGVALPGYAGALFVVSHLNI